MCSDPSSAATFKLCDSEHITLFSAPYRWVTCQLVMITRLSLGLNGWKLTSQLSSIRTRDWPRGPKNYVLIWIFGVKLWAFIGIKNTLTLGLPKYPFYDHRETAASITEGYGISWMCCWTIHTPCTPNLSHLHLTVWQGCFLSRGTHHLQWKGEVWAPVPEAWLQRDC